jgi:aspartate-semialdehyde dehydrogenase
MFNRIGVVGATGAVGRIICELLEQRNFPSKEVVFLASSRSAGSTIIFRGSPHTVQLLTHDCFKGLELIIGSTPDDTAAEFFPSAVKAGCKVIDESGFFRMHEDVALVMPEINPEAALNAKGIISSPNCSTTQMVMALKPLHDLSPLKRVVVSTYQATSGAGLPGTKELRDSTHAHLAGDAFTPSIFQYPIGFNAIPQIGSHKEAGYTSEEMKMVYETRKIMGLPNLSVSATCVRIPVANCHSEVINVETEHPISVEDARNAFAAFPGVQVIDDLPNKKYPVPSLCDGSDDVFIGRIRKDISHPSALTFWCVSDNLRKGAATNAVQIAELLAKHR